MPDADRPRHVHGVVVTTKLGKCLLHCAVGGPGPRPAELRVAPLCQLLATMQDLAGRPPFGYAEVHGSGVVVLEGHSVIVAMLCDARDGRQSARLLGMQLLNTFGQLFRGAVASLDGAHQRAMEAAVSSYTFHSATQRAPGAGGCTMAPFVPFQEAFVRTMLLRPPPADLWLAPLLALPCALRACVLDCAPATGEPELLLATERAAGRPLAAYAGAAAPPVWAAVRAAAAALVVPRATATNKQNRKARVAALAWPRATDGGKCLHAALRAARIAPGSGCVVAFYQAEVPAAAAAAAAGGGGAVGGAVGGAGEEAAAAALALPEAAVPPDLRAALHGAARMVSAAFPEAVSEIGAPPADDDDERPHTPPTKPATAAEGAVAPLTPVQLDLESPRSTYPAAGVDVASPRPGPRPAPTPQAYFVADSPARDRL